MQFATADQTGARLYSRGFHNLKGYDERLLFLEISKIIDKKLECIPQTRKSKSAFLWGASGSSTAWAFCKHHWISLWKSSNRGLEVYLRACKKQKAATCFDGRGSIRTSIWIVRKGSKKPNYPSNPCFTARWMTSTLRKNNPNMQRKCGKSSSVKPRGISTIFTWKRMSACWRTFLKNLAAYAWKGTGWIRHTNIYRRACLGTQC